MSKATLSGFEWEQGIACSVLRYVVNQRVELNKSTTGIAYPAVKQIPNRIKLKVLLLVSTKRTVCFELTMLSHARELEASLFREVNNTDGRTFLNHSRHTRSHSFPRRRNRVKLHLGYRAIRLGLRGSVQIGPFQWVVAELSENFRYQYVLKLLAKRTVCVREDVLHCVLNFHLHGSHASDVLRDNDRFHTCSASFRISRRRRLGSK